MWLRGFQFFKVVLGMLSMPRALDAEISIGFGAIMYRHAERTYGLEKETLSPLCSMLGYPASFLLTFFKFKKK